jgi:hypothetical protein
MVGPDDPVVEEDGRLQDGDGQDEEGRGPASEICAIITIFKSFQAAKLAMLRK